MTKFAAAISAGFAFMLASGPLDAKPPLTGHELSLEATTSLRRKQVVPRAERG